MSISYFLSLLRDTEANVIGILSESFEDKGKHRESANPVVAIGLSYLSRYDVMTP
jgi:hypothetical protein